MRKLLVFNSVSIDGYFVDASGDMSWSHTTDPEFNRFTQENAKGGGELLFGRKTYELMTKYWPTPAAKQNDPVVAEAMNSLPKIVFSRKMNKPDWNNTRLIKENIVDEIRKMKGESGPDMVIFGSGEIVSQVSDEKLVDEYQLVIAPVVLGKGRTMFEGMTKTLKLKLTSSRTFTNGNVFLCYEPARE